MSLQQGTAGNSREQQGTGNKMENQNEQMRKSHIYFFHNNLHFVNKTCWIMMIMAFGILMLGLYDLQVRRVLRYDQNDQDERRCKKIKDAKGEHGDLGYPRIIPQQQTGAAPKPISPRFPGSKYRFPGKGSKVPK